MTEEQPEIPELDSVLQRLHDTVEERRRTGQYPAHLELDLDQHFERIVGLHPAGSSLLRRRLDEVMRASQIGPERIVTTSRLPGGAIAHKTVGKAVSRQTEGILSQVRWFAGSVRETLELIVEVLEEFQPSTGQSDLIDLTARVDSLMDRLAYYERSASGTSPELRSLSARLEQLELELRSQRIPPLPSRAAFLDRFVGSRDAVLESRRSLVGYFRGEGPVLDLDCGRGEMAQALADNGVDARGVEPDPELATIARDAGVPVTVGRSADYLESIPDGSLGGVFMGNVAESMTPQDLVSVVTASAHKIRQGGRLVSHSVDPKSGGWHLDPTHRWPVPAEYMAFLAESAGFASSETMPQGNAAGEEPQEYVIVATR
jgi:SAM-dependent methyltransferase